MLRLQRIAKHLNPPFIPFPDGRLPAEAAVNPVLADAQQISKGLNAVDIGVGCEPCRRFGFKERTALDAGIGPK